MNASVTPFTVAALADEYLPATLPDHYVSPEVPERVFPSFLNRRTGALAGVAIATVAGVNLIQLANQPTQYEGTFQLLVEPITPEPTPSAAPTVTNQSTLAAPSLDYDSQIQVLWSPKLLSPVVEQLQTQYADLNYDTLAKKLDITHREGEKTLEIRYQDTDPQKVQAVLETVSHAYLQYSQSCRTSLCRELKFVEHRLPQLQKQVSVAKHNLQKLQQQSGVTEPAALGQQLSQRSGVLAQQRQDLQIRLTEARTQSAILQNRLTGQADATVADQLLQQNDRYQAQLQQFQTIAQQLTVELARPQPDSATLQTLKQQYQQVSTEMAQVAQEPIARQRAQAVADFQATENGDYTAVIRQQTLLEWVTAVNQVRVLEISQAAIAQTEVQINQQIKQWAGMARQYDALNLELKFATDNLNLYLTKRAELQQIIQPQTNWQLTAASPVEPLSANGVLSDSEQRASVGLLLCFMLVLLVMSIATKTKPRQLQPLPQLNIQPEYSWQTLVMLEQPSTRSMQVPPTLAALQATDPAIARATLFLLMAAVRVEPRKRATIAV